MRDILLTAIVFCSLLLILRKPYTGILVWSWLSYMNPHRLTWGFAYNMPFAQIVAITLLTAVLFDKDKKNIPVNVTTVVWAIFILWMCIATIFSINSIGANYLLVKVLKIQLLTFFTIILITDQKKVDQLIWVIVLSIGFFSIKGGVFTVLSGGVHRVWGPAGSFIEENNSLALATLMLIPLMYYLYQITEKLWIRYFLLFAVISSFASALGSQSRGALVAILAVAGFFWLRSSNRVVTGVLIIALGMAGFVFMPDSWHERMSTIQNYEEDASAMGRINAWKYSINIANARLTGGGFDSWTASTFALYAPNPMNVQGAHSIFFGVLGDHGWPGLVLFLTLLVSTWITLGKIIKKTAGMANNSQANILASMIQLSLLTYVAGGAFLSLAYFDLPWHLIALAVILKRQVDQGQEQENQSQSGNARALYLDLGVSSEPGNRYKDH